MKSGHQQDEFLSYKYKKINVHSSKKKKKNVEYILSHFKCQVCAHYVITLIFLFRLLVPALVSLTAVWSNNKFTDSQVVKFHQNPIFGFAERT